MDALVSKTSMILLSLQPSPASEASAFNKMCAFSSRRAGPFALADQRFKLPAFLAAHLTTYFFTEISLPAMIASIANSGDESESQNPFKLVEAGD